MMPTSLGGLLSVIIVFGIWLLVMGSQQEPKKPTREEQEKAKDRWG